jgi:F-type H+-transporting ATPase subunit delta
VARVRPALVRRYAEALFDVLESAEERERALRLMKRVEAAWAAERGVRVVLGAPSMPVERRIELVRALAGEDLGPALTNLAAMVLERRREGVFALFGRALEDVMDERKGLVRVTVTTAAPLDGRARERVHALAERLAGGPTEVEEVVDEGVIGGLQLRVGDRLIDASLRGYLDQIVEQVVAAPISARPE